MGGQEDFVAALEALRAAKRKELGEPPTPEELLAYRDGWLDPVERQRVEAKIAVYPDAAKALADLAAFPDIEPEPETPELTDADIDARWQAFRQRLPETLPGTPEQAVREPPATVPRRTPRRFPAQRLAAAASIALAIGAAGGFLAGRVLRPSGESSINVTIAELMPVDEGGARAEGPGVAVELPDRSEELVLVLGLQDERRFADYAAEIVDEQGTRVWSREGLRPTSLGTFHLSFRRGVFQPGAYRIRLFGRDGAGKTPLTLYEVRIVAGAEG